MDNLDTQTPPAAVEFEEAVIGAVVTEPERLTEIIDLLTPECFYDPHNARIYELIWDMYDNNEQIDLYTVSQRCNAVPELKQAKVAVKLVGCTQRVGSGAHLIAHAAIVKEMYIRRKLILSAQQLIAKACDTGEDVADVLDFLSKEADISNEIASGEGSGVWVKY